MRRVLVLLGLVLLTQLSLPGELGWDEAAYTMTGRYYWGDHTFFEIIRPPAYPFILGFVEKIGLSQALPLTLTFLFSLSVYCAGTKLFDKRTGFFAALISLSAPLVVKWGARYMTAIPATAFLLLAISFHDEKGFPALFFTMACLTRYPFLAFTPVMLYLVKRKESFLTFSLLLSLPWLVFNYSLTANPLHSMTGQWAYTTNNPSVSPAYYLVQLVPGLGLTLLPLLLVRREDLDHNVLLFIVFYSAFLLFLNHKEARFLIPLIPFTSLIGARPLTRKGKGWALLLLVLVAAFFFKPTPHSNPAFLNKLSGYLKGREGSVITPYWPIISYETNKTVHGPTLDEYLYYWVHEWNVSWVVSEEPVKKGFLKQRKVINSTNNTLFVYEVVE